MTKSVHLWTIFADLCIKICDLCSNIYNNGIINLKHKQKFQFSMFYKINDVELTLFT